MSNSGDSGNPGCLIFVGWLLSGLAILCICWGLFNVIVRPDHGQIDVVALVAMGLLALVFGGPGIYLIQMGKDEKAAATAKIGQVEVLASALAASQAAFQTCSRCGGSFVWPDSFKNGPLPIPANVIDKPIYCPKCDKLYCIQCVKGQCPVCGGKDYKPIG